MNGMDQKPDHEAERRRILRGRNVALALLLGGLVVLFYLITIARMGH